MENDIATHLNAAMKDSNASAFPPALGDAVSVFEMKKIFYSKYLSRRTIRQVTRVDAKPRFEMVHAIARGMGWGLGLFWLKRPCNQREKQ
jgi:DNA-binding phage protein